MRDYDEIAKKGPSEVAHRMAADKIGADEDDKAFKGPLNANAYVSPEVL